MEGAGVCEAHFCYDIGNYLVDTYGGNRYDKKSKIVLGEKKMKKILFVTDYVCPYCLVAKEALVKALQQTGTEAEIKVQPYELTQEPEERVDTCHDEKRKSRYKILEAPAKELGLDMKIPPAVCPRPYTRLAFEGMYFAEEQGCAEAYSDAVYRAYFIDEKDIGDIKILAEIAEKLGLDSQAFCQALETGKYSSQEKEAVAYSKEVLQIQGVPTVYIDGEKVSLKAYTKEEMMKILKG